MAESGKRPPKTEAMVRSYALVLDLDPDDLTELWWATQGLVTVEDWREKREVHKWWADLGGSPQAELDHVRADGKAKSLWTPNEEVYASPAESFAFAEALCSILGRLLDDSWKVTYRAELGLRDPIDGRLAAVMIDMRISGPKGGNATDPAELVASFACPEPLSRPRPPSSETSSTTVELPADIAWILSAVEVMPARERAAVAGFIRGLREGVHLFSDDATGAT